MAYCRTLEGCYSVSVATVLFSDWKDTPELLRNYIRQFRNRLLGILLFLCHLVDTHHDSKRINYQPPVAGAVQHRKLDKKQLTAREIDIDGAIRKP